MVGDQLRIIACFTSMLVPWVPLMTKRLKCLFCDLTAAQFGEIDIDSQLIVKQEALEGTTNTITQLSNGCLCCTVRDDLIQALIKLVRGPLSILLWSVWSNSHLSGVMGNYEQVSLSLSWLDGLEGQGREHYQDT